MFELIHLGVLALTFKLGLSIDQVSPLDNIVFSFDNEASLSLDDFFEGQNLTYSSKDGLSIFQRLELLQSVDRNVTVDPSEQIGLIRTDQASNYLFTLETTSFSIWNTSNIHNLSLIKTVPVEGSSLLKSLNFIQAGIYAPIYVVLIGQNVLSYTVHVFDISDISNVHELENLKLNVKATDPVVQVNSLSYGTFIFVQTSGKDLNIDIINISISTHSTYERVNKRDIGLDDLYSLQIFGTNKKNLFLCDRNNGIISFTIDLNRKFAISNIQRDPLSYGKIYSCHFSGSNVTVATTNGILVYSVPELSFIEKYFRYPSPTEPFELKNSPRVMSYYNLIGTYCVSDDISFRIIDINKGLKKSIVLDEYVSELFANQTPMYTIISQNYLFYLVFALPSTLEVYRIYEQPYVYFPAITDPSEERGTLIVKNSYNYLESIYQIQRINSSSLEIRDWRGPYPDFGFIKVDNFQFMLDFYFENVFYLPISNYFSGQDIEFSVELIEPAKTYTLDIQPYNKIDLKSTTKLPELSGDNLKLYSSSYIYDRSMIAVPGTSENGYLIQLSRAGTIETVDFFSCLDNSRNMTQAINVSYGSDMYFIAECTGEDIVWDTFSISDNSIDYLNSVVDRAKSKFMMVGSHFLSMNADSINIYLFDPKSNNILINLQVIDSKTITDFSPIEMVSNDKSSLLVYDKNKGLIQFSVTNWDSPFKYEILGKFGKDTGDHVKLAHNAGYYYGIIPQTDGSNGIFKFFTQENKVKIVSRYPDFNEKYIEIFSFGKFMYLASDQNNLKIFDFEDYSFESLLKSIPIPNKFSFVANLNEQEHIYVYHAGQIDIYEIFNPEGKIHSNLVPSDSLLFNSYVSLNVTSTDNKLVSLDTAKIKITAKNSTFQTSKAVDIDIYSSGNIIQVNPHFNKKSNLLTHKTQKHVKSPIIEELPLDYFLGNSIQYFLRSQDDVYIVPQPSCNSSTPICLENKVFHKNSSEAYDFTYNNNSLYMISGTEIIEYSLNSTEWIHEASYDLKSMFGDIFCKRIEHIPHSEKIVLISCENPDYSLEIKIIDLNSKTVISSVPIFMHSRFIHIDSSRIYAFDGARLTIYDYNYRDHMIETYVVLTSESFNLDTFEVVGIETYIQGTYILFTSQDILLVKYPSQIISNVQLRDAYHDIGTASIAAGTMLSDNRTIFIVDVYSSLYKFNIQNLSFQQLEEWPYFLYTESAISCKLGVSEYYSTISVPFEYQQEHRVRFANYSKSSLNYIYDQYSINHDYSISYPYPCKTTLIEMENGILNIYGILKDEKTEFHSLFVNPSPKLHVYPTSDINKTSISLFGRSFASEFGSSNLTLDFIPSDGSSHQQGVISKWWFWLIISISIVAIIGVIGFVVIRGIKKRKARIAAQHYSLKEAFRLTANFQ